MQLQPAVMENYDSDHYGQAASEENFGKAADSFTQTNRPANTAVRNEATIQAITILPITKSHRRVNHPQA